MMEAILRSPFGQTILGSAPIRIGSAPGNQLVLNDVSVEPHHAEIRPSDDGYSIVDLSRSSRTFVNKQHLYPNVPEMLQNGDQVSIGNVQLTYEVTPNLPLPPTTPAFGSSGYAGQVPDALISEDPTLPLPPPAYTPTLVASGSNPYASAIPSPLRSNWMGSIPAFDPYEPPPRKRGKMLWIVLSSIGSLVVLSIILVFGFFTRGPTTTPTQALQNYCSAVNTHDTQTAYNMYSSSTQKQNSFLQMQQFIALTTDCTVSNVNDTNATGIVTYTLANGGKMSDRESLMNQKHVWKISAIQPIATSTRILYNYCTALVKSDYQTAYNQFTTNGQSLLGTEQQFAAGFPSDNLTTCTINSANDNAGTGSITLVFPGGKLIFNEQLINNGGTWKIDNEQRPSTPTLTLINYCSSLRQKDYQAAYNQFSSMAQSQEGTEPQFASEFDLTTVTNCFVSNVNDTAGTGSISYTATDNSKAIDAYTLVKENGVWKIKTETTPTLTLDSYCRALKQKDYQTAYNLLSSTQQAAQTESQFASNFSTVTVTDCSVIIADDSAGTGSISYTFSNGSKATADYVLVQEDGTWKIRSEYVL
jgi:limonene-1,2-epoxide hydrolase